MKTLFTALLAVLLIGATLTGCKKEKSNIPQFQFISGAGYTSSDASLAAGQPFKLGFVAQKPENGDALKEIKGSYHINSGNGILGGFDYDLTANPDTFSVTSTYFAPESAGITHNYTFTLYTTGGGTRSLKINITAI